MFFTSDGCSFLSPAGLVRCCIVAVGTLFLTAAAAAFAYRKLFTDMIEGWRAVWTTDAFPFLFVQLANFAPEGAAPSDDR